MHEIEVLYFDGCPSWHHAWAGLGAALVELRCSSTVRLRNVDEMEPAQLGGFAGSPTIRVDGADLFGYEGPVVMACRRYEGNAGRGWPSTKSLNERLASRLR